jgi:hypothetical protein
LKLQTLPPERAEAEHETYATEFIRRLLQHILPKAFVRIQLYGFLSSTTKSKRLPELRRNLQINNPARAAAQTLHRHQIQLLASEVESIPRE